MDKTLFEQCSNNFEKLIADCGKYLDRLDSKKAIESLTIKQCQELKQFCTAEMSRQDKVFSEVRHLLGMGNLTPIQTSKLVKYFKDYSSYRSDIKAIALHLNSITDIPTIPVKAEYKLSVLGNFKLVSDLRCGKEEESVTVLEGVEESIPEASIPVSAGKKYSLQFLPTYKNGCAISYESLDDIDILAEIIIGSTASNKSEDNIKKSLTGNGTDTEHKIANSTKEAWVEITSQGRFLYMPYKTSVAAKRFMDCLMPVLISNKLI